MGQTASFNVLNYGALGDGQTDDSAAFLKAWQDVCGSSAGNVELIIPDRNRRFMLQPILFKGPCKSPSIQIKLFATITAPNSMEAWKWPDGGDRGRWIRFQYINGLTINGRGTFDGQGAPWWACAKAGKCNQRPSALGFASCVNLKLSRLNSVNSPGGHIGMVGGNGTIISRLHLIAPHDSPNTDGIDIAGTTNMLIRNSTIETGDDCVAINGGTSFLNITNVVCGPGHGISIGSLGKGGQFEIVEQIYVKNCTFKEGSTNGARIKTWQGGSGYAKKITFEDIILEKAENPIIIDQHYGSVVNANGGSAVKVSDITYRNVQGISISKSAIVLKCDSNIACTNIVLENVAITSATQTDINAVCQNAQGTCSSCKPSVSCLANN
ncbi:hypothetical protein PIB30_023267 [Stylosanthes scabra]|uniref:Polygalacturonase n=1 Tax=Stylosanthes scabra TaxID=79078 RepID=A0ABU6Z5Z1_9FABA|nr:hypothetical protein [Stylosanthes scabra]